MTSEPRPIPSPNGGDRPGRPTPVRVLMKGGAEEEPRADRTFEVEGVQWTARVMGATSVGTAPDVRAPMVLIGFGRTAESDGVEREAMAAVSSLEQLSDDDLADLLASARSARRPEGTPETS